MQYSDKLHTADEGDKTEWLEYFSDGVKYSLQSALAKVKEGLSRLKVEDRPTKRESEVLEFVKGRGEVTSSDVSQEFDVTRQQAHNLLSSLVDKGFLDKEGSTKNSYYTLR
jgi:predicted HTH transcriptional regulator